MRRSQPRADSALAGARVVRRKMGTLVAGLTLLAVLPLLFALRAPAPAALDTSVASLGPGEPAQSSAAQPLAELPVPEPAAVASPPPSAEPAPNLPALAQEPELPAALPAVSMPVVSVPVVSVPVVSVPVVSAPQPEAASPRKAKAARVPERPNRAWLTITASGPWNVLLDGRALGTTPLENVAIEPGEHEVLFLHDGERSAQSVTIRAGEHKRVAASLQAVVGDGLDEAAVQRTLRSYGPSVRDICWEGALRQRAVDAPSSVRVSTTITVAASGRVQAVTSSGAPEAYPELSACIEGKIRAWTFPRALGETVVNVPFVFVVD